MRSDVVNAVLEKGSEAIVSHRQLKFGCVHLSPGPLWLHADSGCRPAIKMRLEHAGLLVNVDPTIRLKYFPMVCLWQSSLRLRDIPIKTIYLLLTALSVTS